MPCTTAEFTPIFGIWMIAIASPVGGGSVVVVVVLGAGQTVSGVVVVVDASCWSARANSCFSFDCWRAS